MVEVKVWDRSTRIFHWINFISILGLLVVGFLMLYKKELGIVSLEAKIALKQLHVIIGYVFAMNLAWRIFRLFSGGFYSRWQQVFPGKGYIDRLKQNIHAEKAGQNPQYAGHNPVGQLAITVLFALFVVLAVTGLIRAGTDIYYPPFGGFVADYVVADGESPAALKPYDKTAVDSAKMAKLKAFKGPFGDVHVFAAYFLMFIIFIHIFAVVYAEIKKQPGIISAMFSGSKYFERDPVDKQK